MSLHKLRVTAEDGASSDLLITQKRGAPSQPLVFCLPAMGMPARKYRHLAQAFDDAGMASALFEYRGIGSSSIRASRRENFGLKEKLELDLPAAMAMVKSRFPENPVYLLGHSLGAQLAMIYLSLAPDSAKGLIGVATGTPYFNAWPFPKNIGLLAGSKVMRGLAALVGHYPGKRVGFAGNETRQVVKDWASWVPRGRYQVAGYDGHFEPRIGRLKQPALIVTIEKDMMAPPEPARVLGDKMSAGRVTYQHLVASDFEQDSLGHFKWMKEPAPVVTKINHWIQNARRQSAQT